MSDMQPVKRADRRTPQEKAEWAMAYVKVNWQVRVLPMIRAIKKIPPGERGSMLRTLAEDIYGFARAIEEGANYDDQK